MKVNRLILFLVVKLSVSEKLFTYKESIHAIYNVVEELFIKKDLRFEILSYGLPTNHINDVIDYIQMKNKNCSVIISKFDMKWLKESWIDREVFRHGYLIIFTKSIKSLLTFILNIDIEKHPHFQRKIHFLSYVEEPYNLEELKKYEDHWKPNRWYGKIVQHMYFLRNTNTTLEFFTLEWWTIKVCHTMQIMTLNRFNKKKLEWNDSLKTDSKFLNFHGCKFNTHSRVFNLNMIDFLKTLNLVHIHPQLSSFLEKKYSLERIIMDAMAKKGNFISEFSVTEEKNTMIMYLFSMDRYYGLDIIAHFYEQYVGVMISPPMSYNSYEKLILPFDRDTWIYLILVFFGAFIGIFVINKLPKTFKELVFGRKVKMPSFNVLGTFFGIGQTKLPENNFGRIILMHFIIFCLIFRTAYQGKRFLILIRLNL